MVVLVVYLEKQFKPMQSFKGDRKCVNNAGFISTRTRFIPALLVRHTRRCCCFIMYVAKHNLTFPIQILGLMHIFKLKMHAWHQPTPSTHWESPIAKFR
jgi:hypothetical protein